MVKIPTLPRTFEDAIAFARKLRIRYLWIDSLCIIQGDTEDWQMECSIMDKVYQNSFCNLAATVSIDSHGGLFFNRPSLTLNDVLIPEYRYPESAGWQGILPQQPQQHRGPERFRLLDKNLFLREVANGPLLKVR